MHPADKQWATPVPAGVALVLGGVALAVAALASYQDAVGLVLIGIAALGLIVLGSVTLLRRPRLALTVRPDGPELAVRSLSGVHSLRPDSVDSIELLGTRRLAFSSTQLLVEGVDGKLFVFGRWDLGAQPQAVAEDLEAAGFPVKHRT